MQDDSDYLDEFDQELELRSTRRSPPASSTPPEVVFTVTAADVAWLKRLGIDATRKAPRKPPSPLHVVSNQINERLRPELAPSAEPSAKLRR